MTVVNRCTKCDEMIICERCEEKDEKIQKYNEATGRCMEEIKSLESQNCELQKENERLSDEISKSMSTEMRYTRLLDYIKLNTFLETGRVITDSEITKAIRGF